MHVVVHHLPPKTYRSSLATVWPDSPLEPVYLHFPSRTTLRTWLALFRSCVRPETYGAQLAPQTHGGLYRMWRAIDLTLIAGRNIGSGGSSSSWGVGTSSEKDRARKEVSGNLKWYGRTGYGGGANPSRAPGSGGGNASGSTVTGASTSGLIQDPGSGKGKDKSMSLGPFHQQGAPSMNDEKELLPSEDDIFCTIYVAGELSARSSIQGAPPKSENVLMAPLSADNTPIWDETFEFDYLPRFSDTPQSERSENNILRILVYRIPRKSNLERLVQGAMRNVTPPTSHFGSTLEPSTHSQQTSSSTSSSHILPGTLSPSTPAFDLYNPSASGSNSSNAQNQILIGKVDIPLGTFRRGEVIDSHWPIVPEPIAQSRRSHSGIVLGELRLKIRVDEYAIKFLPIHFYRCPSFRLEPLLFLFLLPPAPTSYSTYPSYDGFGYPGNTSYLKNGTLRYMKRSRTGIVCCSGRRSRSASSQSYWGSHLLNFRRTSSG
jgi:hypothetical protein